MKTYTKKQIQEAIKYWEGKLKELNESFARPMPPSKFLQMFNDENPGDAKCDVQIEFDNQFYDVDDIYTIEDDNRPTLLCIKARPRK